MQTVMHVPIGRVMALSKVLAVSDLMKRWLSCGQYTICIEGSNSILSKVRLRWNLFSEKASDAVLHIEEVLLEGGAGFSDGWELQEKKESSLAVYCRNGKALIGLEHKVANFVTVLVRECTDSYIRMGIQFGLMLVLYQDCIGFHGVTLLCGNEIVILSAPSGTGKTTLAKLLEKYCDAVVINGDFALLRPTEDSVIFEPTPFCGSSGRCLNHRVRVNRVVFLGQAKENRWRELGGREAMARFMSNAFVPDWDKNKIQVVQKNILKCASMLKVNAFDFTPTRESAELFLKKMEEDGSSLWSR